MATEKVLIGKLNIIIDNLDSSGEGSLGSIKSNMKNEAGYDSADEEVVENIQYVQGKYNITYAYYDNVDIPATPANNS